MSEEPKNTLNQFEWYLIKAGERWYDELEKRIFINTTNHDIKIGFGHNGRRVEIIAIGEDKAADAVSALEGEIIEEDQAAINI